MMMGPYHRQQSTLLILALAFTCCVAPKCFSCNSLKNRGCGDHFALSNTAAHYCDRTCVKMRGERYSDSVRVVEVTRMCIPQREDGCYDTVWNGISVEACACNTDFCNTASRTAPLPMVHIFLAAVVCWMYYR